MLRLLIQQVTAIESSKPGLLRFNSTDFLELALDKLAANDGTLLVLELQEYSLVDLTNFKAGAVGHLLLGNHAHLVLV